MAGSGASEEKQLRLLGVWASPYVWRVKLGLHVKGLPYDYVEEDFKNKSDLLLQSNPVHKKVPVLIHAGRPICESLVILQYLDAAFPGTGPALLPADPYERAIQLFWVAYITETATPAWVKMMHAKTEEEKQEAVKQVLGHYQVMESSFKELFQGKDFLGGDSIGYLDIVLGCTVPWLPIFSKMLGVELIGEETTPFLAAWKDRFLLTETAKEVFPDAARLTEYLHSVLLPRLTGSAPSA